MNNQEKFLKSLSKSKNIWIIQDKDGLYYEYHPETLDEKRLKKLEKILKINDK